MSNKPYGFGISGILIGGFFLAILYLIEVYGPGSYSSSGSVILKADGTFMSEISTPLIPTIARVIFYLFLIPLSLSVVSFVRKENIFAATGALVCGLAPVLLMTIGVIVMAWFYFGLALPVAGVMFYRKIR